MELNVNQLAAARYDGGHTLVLAGAGTGKTRTIIARAAHLIQNHVAPERILLLTFTRRAAREMTGRLSVMIGPAARSIPAGTFHHFCLLTMRRMPAQFGVENATVVDRDDQIQLMKLARASLVKKGEQFPTAAQLVNTYSFARNTNKGHAEYLQRHSDFDPFTIEKIGEVFTAYEARKRENRYLDFDDLLHRFARRLNEDARVRDRLKGMYDHILVDEMQDTNPLQWLILEGLRDPGKLFCVGDDAQSIYAFRGADFQNVHAFTDRVPGGKVLRLEENYRSSQEILDLANWLLDGSTLEYGKHLTACRGNGSRPRLLDFASDFAEANWIAGDLWSRHDAGAPWRDHMIMVRTAWAARALEGILVEKGIPYVFVGGASLLQAAHVKDLLAMARASLSHYDELAWIRYLTLFPRIGDVSASRLIGSARSCGTLAEAFAILAGKLAGRPEILDAIRLVQACHDTPAKALKAAGNFLQPYLAKRYDNWENRRKDLDLLVRLAERHTSLPGFLETYTLDPVTTLMVERQETDDQVTLITVHSAKGTEAPVCYLVRVEPGMYPHARSVGDPEQEEEERRILYVAMTRARDELILSRTMVQNGYRVFYGATRPYFLNDLPEDLVAWETEGDVYDDFGGGDVIHPW